MEKNKGYLLDTHMFIWWMDNDKRLPKEIFILLSDPHSTVFLSIASVWEIVIKQGKKMLKIPKDVKAGVLASGFELLPIDLVHVLAIKELPHHHKDPFDRMLIAQAKVENLKLLTDDEKVKKYKVHVAN
jgi:PIN domain nuclease of toxin-antitoxin system